MQNILFFHIGEIMVLAGFSKVSIADLAGGMTDAGAKAHQHGSTSPRAVV